MTDVTEVPDVTANMQKGMTKPGALIGIALSTNDRPISNLTFISKVLERIVAEQVTQNLKEADLTPEFQSAYRKHHSTESPLMKILSDTLDEADPRQVTLLALRDLSAAFDTVDLIRYWWIRASVAQVVPKR